MTRRSIGDPGGDDHSADLTMAVRLELSAGETLLWVGRPRSVGRLVRRTLPGALLGLAMLAFTLLWMALVVRGGNNNWDRGRAVRPLEPHNVAIAALAGLWMIPPSLYVLAGPLRTRRRLEGTCYALTDRRTILIEPGLLGRPRVRSDTADSLRLMRLEEHDDGTGDLVFECLSTRLGMGRPVGFLGIEGAREVETLLRRTLLEPGRTRRESDRTAADRDPTTSGRKAYRLAMSVRLFQFVFLAAGLLLALCLIADVAILLVALIFWPRRIFAIIGAMNVPAGFGAVVAIAGGAGAFAMAILIGSLFFHFALVFPIEIRIDDDGTVGFRNRLRTIRVPAADITSIRTGGWSDPNRFGAIVQFRGGKLRLINRFADFRDFLARVRQFNPTVEIDGF